MTAFDRSATQTDLGQPLDWRGGPARPKVAPRRIGGLVAVAGAAIVLASFGTWSDQTVTQTDHTQSGDVVKVVTKLPIPGTSSLQDGNLTVVLGGLLLVVALLIACRQGRLWVSMAGTAISAFAVLVALTGIGNVHDQNGNSIGSTFQVGSGLSVVLAAAVVAVCGCFVAILVRQDRK